VATETETECRARGGTPVYDTSGRYIACYPPPRPGPINDVIDKVRREARDRQILLALAVVALAAVYFDDK
jgi:hypothetical protein